MKMGRRQDEERKEYIKSLLYRHSKKSKIKPALLMCIQEKHRNTYDSMEIACDHRLKPFQTATQAAPTTPSYRHLHPTAVHRLGEPDHTHHPGHTLHSSQAEAAEPAVLHIHPAQHCSSHTPADSS
jgi:hypothetical protein